MPRPVVTLALVVAFMLATPAAHAQSSRRWGDVTLGFDAVALFSSDYDATLRAFDHKALGWAFSTALRVSRAVLPWLQLGGRAGWLWTTSGLDQSGSTALVPSDAPMDFHVVDLSGLARFVATGLLSNIRVHFDLEAGAALGNVTLLGVTQRWVRPRLGAAVFLGYQPADGRGLFGVRMGFQFIPWDGAGGSSLDPVFSGFHIGIEGGLSP